MRAHSLPRQAHLQTRTHASRPSSGASRRPSRFTRLGAPIFFALLFATTLVSAAILPAPKWPITIPINSTTEVGASSSNTIASEAAGTTTSDPNTFTMGSGATATANLYAGLYVQFAAGDPNCASNAGLLRIIKSNTGANPPVATLDVPTTAAVGVNCTYIVGPRINTQCREITAGGGSGTIYYSNYTATDLTTHGGTLLTMRFPLSGGQFRTIWNPASRFNYVGFLSASATDTVTLECQF